MKKEFEIEGCISVDSHLTHDDFLDIFLEFVESKGWYFGGGTREIIDGYYINNDGTKGNHVSMD